MSLIFSLFTAPSGPPRDVVGSPRSETSIILRWQAPDEDKWNGPLHGYIIRYKPSGYPDETLTYENITSRLQEMHELRGLIVFQEYEIAIAAYNKKGVGVGYYVYCQLVWIVSYCVKDKLFPEYKCVVR